MKGERRRNQAAACRNLWITAFVQQPVRKMLAPFANRLTVTIRLAA
jgi:hypothetical protein